ncbi:hypothetical protein BKA70DRAFT_1566702 [Coprinopsis sp. MPI-PUGE-AT-0042]|nr:hypothetical protein BKA70DRAFT_1566702 [Coprinopsis sp. MPI-PUGE-AT-0042]
MSNGVSQNARSSISPSTQAAKIVAFDPLCQLKSTIASFDSTSLFDISRRTDCETTRFVSTNELRSRDSHTPAADQATVKIRLLVDSIPGKSLGARPKARRESSRLPPPTSLKDFGVSESYRDGRIKKGNVEVCVETTKSGPVASSDGPTSAAADQETAIGLGGTRHNTWKGMEKSLEILRFGRVKILDHARTCTPSFLHGTRRSQPISLFNDRQSEAHDACPSTPTPFLLLLTHIPEATDMPNLAYLLFFFRTLAISRMAWPLLQESITPHYQWGQNCDNNSPSIRHRGGSISIQWYLHAHLAPSSPQPQNSNASATRTVKYSLVSTQMKGGTITVSNVGAVGKRHSGEACRPPGGGIAVGETGRAEWLWDVEDEFLVWTIWRRSKQQGRDQA